MDRCTTHLRSRTPSAAGKPAGSSGTTNRRDLRPLLREAADQLCHVVDGDFDFVVQVSEGDDDIDKLLLLVNFVLAVSRRSLNDLHEIHRRIEEDLAAARKLQEKLLPQRIPTARNLRASARCVPARAVGGDFFDFFRYERSGLYAGLLADVSGKGAAAALYAALASGIVSSLIERELSPPQMLSALNRSLFKRAPEEHFITLAYSTWDDKNLLLEFCSAGLPEPLLCRNGEVQQLSVHGLPLGLFPETQYEVARIHCKPGDVFLFFTDGVADAVDSDDNEFGARRLAEVLLDACKLKTAAIVETVFERVCAFGKRENSIDDQTVIAMKVL